MRDNIDELDEKNAINETDLIFLKGLMDSPVLHNLVKVSDLFVSEAIDFPLDFNLDA